MCQHCLRSSTGSDTPSPLLLPAQLSVLAEAEVVVPEDFVAGARSQAPRRGLPRRSWTRRVQPVEPTNSLGSVCRAVSECAHPFVDAIDLLRRQLGDWPVHPHPPRLMAFWLGPRFRDIYVKPSRKLARSSRTLVCTWSSVLGLRRVEGGTVCRCRSVHQIDRLLSDTHPFQCLRSFTNSSNLLRSSAREPEMSLDRTRSSSRRKSVVVRGVLMG